MDNWIAFPKKDLMQEIFLAEFNLDDKQLILWNQIKISPEIWKCKDVIEENFWVVAKSDHYIIWYNDISEGFCISNYQKEKEITAYKTSNYDLNDAIYQLLIHK